jgi:hypothetical protein
MSDEQKSNAEALTLQAVQEFLNSNDEGKKWLQAEKDKTVTKGLETWRTNNLPKIIDEEITKRFPAETPEQRRLKDLEQQLAMMERQAKRATLKAQALGVAGQNNIPADLVDYLVGEDEETTLKNIEKAKTALNSLLQNAAQVHFKDGGRKVPPPGGSTKTELQELEEQYDKAKGAEKIALNRRITALRNQK